ncbi:MAG: hypothetical protein AB8B83_05420 [Bdellovibrionales bacterium]
MYPEPEILVSKNRDVLDELRNPFTHAVCWDAREDDRFQSLVDNVVRLKGMLDISGTQALRVSLGDALEDNHKYVLSVLPEIQLIVGDAYPEFTLRERLGRLFTPPGSSKNAIPRPHTDKPKVTAYFSFNRKADALACIPNQFAGVSDNGLNVQHYPDARMDRTVRFPSSSIYIVDIRSQVHMGTDRAPNDEWRVVDYAVFS